MQRSALCRGRRELSNAFISNAYLLAKFGFDTAENEPCKVCPLSVYRSPRYLASDYETLLKLSEAQSRRLEKRFLTKEKTWTADKERLEETLRKERSDFSEMASKLKQLTAMEEETDRIRSALIATDQAMVEN